jgi:hypothetical protein
MRSVQCQIKRGEGKLAAIKHARGRKLGVFHFLDCLPRNLFRRVMVIRRERIEHALIPHPVLQHLRGSFDEVRGHMRAGETGVFRVCRYRMQDMTEFVKQDFDLVMGQQ